MPGISRWVTIAVAVPLAAAGCDALTAHSRTAAESAGYRLASGELGQLMAQVDSLPTDSLTPELARRIAQLWGDYVRLAALYQHDDSANALDYSPLLQQLRVFDQMAVNRFRDSLMRGQEQPSEKEVRAYFEERQPFTRLDVRVIRFPIPPAAADAVRDSLRAIADQVRQRAAGGADFIDLARTWSDDPPAARGQLLGLQGHEDFPAAADSIVFRLAPGEVSPVITTDEALVIYRVEERHVPSLERAYDRVSDMLVADREQQIAAQVTDTLFDHARIMVLHGAAERARKIARDPASELERERPEKLVAYEGGAVTAEELARILYLRFDLDRLFLEGSDADIETYLGEIARDDVLSTAAERAGYGPTRAEKDSLNTQMAKQLARVANRLGIYHNLVASPQFELKPESLAFLQRVLEQRKITPMVGGFAVVLARDYPVHLDEHGLAAAAVEARRLRAKSAEEATATSQPVGSPAGSAGSGAASTTPAAGRAGVSAHTP